MSEPVSSTEIVETVRLDVLPYLVQVRATFPDGTVRFYRNQRTATSALNRYHDKRVAQLRKLLGDSMPEFTTKYDWRSLGV